MATTIRKLTDTAELACWYRSQTAPQSCFVELDCRAQTLRANYKPEIGYICPSSVWHGHNQRWTIPILTAGAANKLMEAILPVCDRVVAGYESCWDGSNNVARFSEDATDAIDEIGQVIGEMPFNDFDLLSMVPACEWLYDARHDLGVTATTTDDELGEMAQTLDAEELDNQNVVMTGTLEYLESLRDRL